MRSRARFEVNIGATYPKLLKKHFRKFGAVVLTRVNEDRIE